MGGEAPATDSVIEFYETKIKELKEVIKTQATRIIELENEIAEHEEFPDKGENLKEWMNESRD